jgi:hypothetical protein
MFVVERFIPYAQLMPHVDLLLTNGGYGSIQIALAHGVPVVAIGKTEEKPEIANRVNWSGVGIGLKVLIPTEAQIRDAVEARLRGADADSGATIPLLLAGRDLIGQAQTGTGKTAAFALPILEKIDPDEMAQAATRRRWCSRRRASWRCRSPRRFTRTRRSSAPVSVLPVYGGAPMVPQLKRLERGAHVVVGTPGRLIDHLERKSLNLSSTSACSCSTKRTRC